MSNLKIDIIYYKTASDFELEFNLSGCCRMRMFKDKADTPKGLINTLARDVSRSKIIIVVSDLFGDNSGVSVISKAIKLPLATLNKEEYGVTTTDEILIPITAVPLVTKSGVYGGCIIENGPQSIIIVSSARTLRHEIMKTYVHNYVFDVGQYLAYQERMNSSNLGKHAESPLVEEPTISKPITEETVNEIEEIPQDIHSATINNFTIMSEEDANRIIAENELRQNKERKKGKGFNIALLIIVILLLVGFGVLAYYFVYLPLLGEPSVFTDGSANEVTEFLSSLFS